MVASEVMERTGMEVKDCYVRAQLRELGLRYKKVKQIPFQGNTQRSLVLRQRWSLNFLGQDYKAWNVINCDETWLGMADFRRMHWKLGKVLD